jgi:hypothetical protein
VSATLGFGKHKGEPIEGVPIGYLRFCLTLENLYPKTRAIVEAELARREQNGGTESHGGEAPASKTAPTCGVCGLGATSATPLVMMRRACGGADALAF